jgi:hypothetical protein
VLATGVESAPTRFGQYGTCRHTDEDYLTPFIGMVVIGGVALLSVVAIVRALVQRRRGGGELTRSAEPLGPSGITRLRRWGLRAVAVFALWAAWPAGGLPALGAQPVRGLLLVAILILAISSRGYK